MKITRIELTVETKCGEYAHDVIASISETLKKRGMAMMNWEHVYNPQHHLFEVTVNAELIR